MSIFIAQICTMLASILMLINIFCAYQIISNNTLISRKALDEWNIVFFASLLAFALMYFAAKFLLHE